jgi:hypothetical protein
MNWSVFKHFHGCGSPPTYDVISTRSLSTVAKGVRSENSALLMAAAPDLLEALERCTEILWDMTGYLEECRQEPEEQAHQAMKAARAAINKATGVQS